jgi:hypothetical protein
VVLTILKEYEFVNGKDDIAYIVENNKCAKPPTSQMMILMMIIW